MRSARVLTVAAILIGTLGLGVPEATAKPKKIPECPTAITVPGAYFLDKNLDAVDVNCITILTDFVTIDLSGNTLTGNGSQIGITDGGAARRGISIYNGTITNFAHGIDLANSTDSEVRKVRAIANGALGIRVGFRNTVSDNIANSNGDDGIVASNDNTISHNTASGNGDDGIVAGSKNTISNNTANNNGVFTADGTGITATCAVNSVSNIFENTAQGNDVQASVAGCQLTNNVGF